MTDIEIASATLMRPIDEIAAKLSLHGDDIEPYGKYKAKINKVKGNKSGKLILVTAINPTSLGEGKTTTSIGLADGLARMNKQVCLALREPSLGPVFGIKGGATGGGHAQVLPMDDINLHFTGDIHAITCANNLISAIIDNHIQQGNELNIDPRRICHNRCVDLNDRSLRDIVIGLGGSSQGVPRQDKFNITAGSEMMAVLCLSSDLMDLKSRVADMIVGFTYDGKVVKCGDLGIQDAVAILLKDAIKPNLVQTLEGTPAIIHGGPFANIAHGCNSIIATKTAMSISDYVVTEAGFGADLGAEKFMDIKCRAAGIMPDAVVLVATVRALKYNGGMKENFAAADMQALQCGIGNLLRHIDNLRNVFNVNLVVAINKFVTDTDNELNFISEQCALHGAVVATCEAWEKGGEGGISLAKAVVGAAELPSNMRFAYDIDDDILTKLTKIATKIYGAASVELSTIAKKKLKDFTQAGFGNYPICIAKTQYSFTDDAKMLGAPCDFVFHIQDLEVRGGARFVVAIAGNIMLMPGLAKRPAALNMSIDENNVIKGLF